MGSELQTADGNDLVAEFIHRIQWGELPEDVRAKAKLCLLDGLGAMIAGTRARVTQITREYVQSLWPQGNEATVVLSGSRSTAVGAAMVNATAANALDIDDDGKYTEGHPGAQIVPVTLALAEKTGASGKEALTALVVGYEVAHRIGRCWHDHHDTFRACGSWGAVANSAVAARLLELGAEETKHALGIAEYFSPTIPIMRDIDHPAMVKHGIGWGALTGIMAAGLAARGYTSVPSMLGFDEYREWVADIGRNYLMVSGVTFKRFACCLWAQPAFYPAAALIKSHQLRLEEIAAIRVFGFNEMVRMNITRPRDEEQAQFSVAWPLAAFLVAGEVGPEQMLQEHLDDPVIGGLAAKVELIETEEMNRLYESDHYPCMVEIVLENGSFYRSPVVYYDSGGYEGGSGSSYGDITSEAEVKAKFRWLCRSTIAVDQISKCMQLVAEFDALADVGPLMGELA